MTEISFPGERPLRVTAAQAPMATITPLHTTAVTSGCCDMSSFIPYNTLDADTELRRSAQVGNLCMPKIRQVSCGRPRGFAVFA